MTFLTRCVPAAARSLLGGENPGISKTALLRYLVDKAALPRCFTGEIRGR